MAKRTTYIFILILSVALLGFTASRTIDLLALFLPVGQAFWAWLGLAAFDIGLLGWTLFFAHGARGSYQRAIALMMVVLCLLAVAVSTCTSVPAIRAWWPLCLQRSASPCCWPWA